jgi:hypothetical protein
MTRHRAQNAFNVRVAVSGELFDGVSQKKRPRTMAAL